MQPKISVIVPVYKAEKYLHRCVDSILAQTFTDFELLLINDGSPDNSGAICDEYARKDSRINVFHKENGGVSSARNFGLDKAKGEYITFCDADDYVGEEWLTVYNNAIINKIDLAIQGIHYITNEKALVTVELTPYNGISLNDKHNLIIQLWDQGLYGYPVNKLFRRQIIEQHNIRFDIKSAFREDAQFFSKYLEYTTTFCCIDKENYFYILPTADKKYNGDSFYSLLPIFQSLDIIYNRELPVEICKMHYVNIKDGAAKYITEGKTLTEYHIDLYRRMVTKLGYTRGVKNFILNNLIINSGKLKKISKLAISLIQKL